MIRPEIVYHHAWRKGDVLVIDDRATMHRAHGDYDRSQSRVLWRIIVEGVAEDGTIEAIRVADAPAFALGVQWHAEHDPQGNAINRALFRAFGEAVAARRDAA